MLARLTRYARRFAVGLVSTIAVILLVLGLLLAYFETPWGKRQLLALIVRQANNYLTANLEIGELNGSLLTTIELRNIRLSREGETIVSLDAVSLDYKIRELVQTGTTVRMLRLTRPRVVARRQPDGRWNLSALVKRQARDRERTGPGRPIAIQSVEIVDGNISLTDPLAFGSVQVPRRFEQLNASFSFAYKPVEWSIDFKNVSWSGRPDSLTVERLAGRMSSGHNGWDFEHLSLRTPESAFVLDGQIERSDKPSVLNLRIEAERFAFQEWAGVLSGLKNIAITSSFTATLKGPLASLVTDLDFHSNGGDARGALTLDTTVPGWLGVGAMDLSRLNLAPWFSRPDRLSDITGRATFNLALQLGRGIPRGTYTFKGPHAAYFGYEGERIDIRGDITADQWRVAGGTAIAYGSGVRLTSGSIGLASPYPFRFQGAAQAVDLRRLPVSVPVPHVDSTLAVAFDTSGRFVAPFLSGRAQFSDSIFIGSRISAGATGTIDTSGPQIRYSGEGDISDLDVQRYGRALQIAWMQDPRYEGTLAGHFHADGIGSSSETMTLNGGGHLTRATMFRGMLTDADVELQIADGSLTGAYSGGFTSIDPAIPFADPRLAGGLTGNGNVRVAVRDFLRRAPKIADYDVAGTLAIQNSTLRDIQIDRGNVTAALSDSRLTVDEVRLAGPLLEGNGAGSIRFDDEAVSEFRYEITRGDLAFLGERLGKNASGEFVSKGVADGPFSAIHLTGDGTVSRLSTSGIAALVTSGTYDVTVPWTDFSKASAHASARSSFVELSGQAFREVVWETTYANDTADYKVQLSTDSGTSATVDGAVHLRGSERALDITKLAVTFGAATWGLDTTAGVPVLSWNDEEIAVAPPAVFSDTAGGDQRIEISGNWRDDGKGAAHVVASHVFLDTFMQASGSPAPYGGLLNLDAVVSGTRETPTAIGSFDITEGRVDRLSYEKLAGSVQYGERMLTLDVRLNQAPGVWLTAVGTAPALFARDGPELPINLKVRSSRVALGLLESLTTVVRNVTGELVANLDVVGTNKDPHFVGTLELDQAGFVVASTGARYKNGVVKLDLSTDRITVGAFRLEDRNGQPLEVSGSLGTHELRVGEVEIDVRAKGFEVLNNQAGTAAINIDRLRVRGQMEAPRITGDITIVKGDLRVDEFISRALLLPYSTQALPSPSSDAAVVRNLWDRITLDQLGVHSQAALRLTGDSVLVTENAALGLSGFDIRATGDIFLDKQPGEAISTSGSLESLTGSFVFQGRRFELYPSSSIDFRGDFNPQVFIAVYRVVSGVETRVTITGTVRQPELQLSSNPPLDPSDVFSLIVFGTSTNDLTATQQQELTVRAGTLAVGFLANSLTTALERSLGIDIFEIEPDIGDRGTKVTVGQEIAPGLVARFSRHFGSTEYDEATIEYQITRLLRLRATFTDSPNLVAGSPFRRVERAGIDLLIFFSF